MADESTIPDEVEALVRERIHAVEELEVLLLLSDDAQLAWTVADIARAVRVAPSFVIPAVRDLVARGLLQESSGSEPTWRYAPASTELSRAVAALRDTYANQRLEVLVLISKNAIARVRSGALHTFAEAFRLRGRKNDG